MGLNSRVRESKLQPVLHPLNGHGSDNQAEKHPVFRIDCSESSCSPYPPLISREKKSKLKDNLGMPVSVAPDRREEDHFCL